VTQRPVVLNTRPRDQAAALSVLLADAGLEPVETPAVAIVPAWHGPEIAAVLAALRARRYAWLVVPSRNAAHLLIDALTTMGGGAADLATANVLCGTGTAAELQAAGVSVTRPLERFSASAALEFLASDSALAAVADRAGHRVLVPHAAEGHDELVLGLAALGVGVDAPVLYRTCSVPPAALTEAGRLLAADAVAAVTFTSPSAVVGLVAGLRGLRLTPDTLLTRPALVCLGTTTAEAARRAGLPVTRTADHTSLPSLVQAVCSALSLAPVAPPAMVQP